MKAWTSFLLAFSALLPMINPLGSALVFLGLVGDGPPALDRFLARRIAVSNVLFLGAFELFGQRTSTFCISLRIVQITPSIVVSTKCLNSCRVVSFVVLRQIIRQSRAQAWVVAHPFVITDLRQEAGRPPGTSAGILERNRCLRIGISRRRLL